MSQEQPPFGLPGPILAEIQRRPRSRIKFSWPPSVALAVTPANSTTFWNTIYFYTASATAGNLSYDCARGRHRTVSAAASRRHVDASLDLFAREKNT